MARGVSLEPMRREHGSSLLLDCLYGTHDANTSLSYTAKRREWASRVVYLSLLFFLYESTKKKEEGLRL